MKMVFNAVCALLLSAATANATDTNIIAAYESGKNRVDDTFTLHGTNSEVVAIECGDSRSAITIELGPSEGATAEAVEADLSDGAEQVPMKDVSVKIADGHLGYLHGNVDRSFLGSVLKGFKNKTSFTIAVKQASGIQRIVIHNATTSPKAHRVFYRFAMECAAS
jgi:hypothetical protein